MARKLKVFRTPAGFHDAYVAAPSRKAALEAWGADVDLFARGNAEEVSDSSLMAEPLAKPGEVVMRSRGGLADQLKALGPRKVARKKAAPSKARKAAKPPSRAALDKAEAAIDAMKKRQAEAMRALTARREAIERELEALAERQKAELKTFQRRVADARDAYRDALSEWSDS